MCSLLKRDYQPCQAAAEVTHAVSPTYRVLTLVEEGQSVVFDVAMVEHKNVSNRIIKFFFFGNVESELEKHRCSQTLSTESLMNSGNKILSMIRRKKDNTFEKTIPTQLFATFLFFFLPFKQ